MLSRALFDLARAGYVFPKPDALRLRESRPQSYPAVRIRVVKPFRALRRSLEVGETVSLPEPDAADACALGRAVRL